MKELIEVLNLSIKYDDKQLFFELTDDFKTNREAFCRYAHHILEMMA